MSNITKARQDGMVIDISDIQNDDDRVYKAYKMQQAGADLETITRMLGYKNVQTTRMNLREYVQTAAIELQHDRRMEVLQLQLDRMETIISSQWEGMLAGDPKSAQVILNTIATIGRFMGFEHLHENPITAGNKTIIIGTEEFADQLKAIAEAG
jgi:hypothetical protein